MSELKPTRARKGPDDRLTRLEGTDPPPKEPLPNMVTDEEMKKPKRTETAIEAALEVFRDDLLDPDAVQAEIDAMNAAEGTVITPDGAVADAATGEVLSPAVRKPWVPDSDDFITLRGRGGGTYLPARKRINWFRGGAPVDHPNWGISTALVTHNIGRRTGPGKVEGGYALVSATIFDELGRTIATAMKTEYSENFADYVEKAETGAIARALAVAGYGTESALDLDEGYDADRLADAPAKDGRPIVIGDSDVKEVRQGGRQTRVTAAQIAAVGKEVKRLGIGPDRLAQAMGTLLGSDFSEFEDSDLGTAVEEQITRLSFDDAGKLIQALMAAEPPKEEADEDVADEDEDDDALAAALMPDDIGAK